MLLFPSLLQSHFLLFPCPHPLLLVGFFTSLPFCLASDEREVGEEEESGRQVVVDKSQSEESLQQKEEEEEEAVQRADEPMEEPGSEEAHSASSGQEAEVQASDLQWQSEDEPLFSQRGKAICWGLYGDNYCG